jgi:hypothetical protein
VVRVPISPRAFRAFRDAAPPAANLELDWLGWLSKHHYHGPEITFERVEACCRHTARSIDELLRGWVKEDDSKRARDHYDAKRGEWSYLLVDFSDNFLDYVRTLNVLQHIATFKDSPPLGHALVFHHLFEKGQVDALLRIECQKAAFIEPSDAGAEEFIAFARTLVDRQHSWRRWFS